MSESESEARRRRWISFGELIAVLALVVSAAGVWVSWKTGGSNGSPTPSAQQKAIPLRLRGEPSSDGLVMTITPADPAHALESMKVTVPGAAPMEVGSDGRLEARDIEAALSNADKQAKDTTYSVPLQINARYVEDGEDRTGGGTYILRYRWHGGGLFGGRSLEFVSLSR